MTTGLQVTTGKRVTGRKIKKNISTSEYSAQHQFVGRNILHKFSTVSKSINSFIELAQKESHVILNFVVYFIQQTDAWHPVCWLRSTFPAFLLRFPLNVTKKRKSGEKSGEQI